MEKYFLNKWLLNDQIPECYEVFLWQTIVILLKIIVLNIFSIKICAKFWLKSVCIIIFWIELDKNGWEYGRL